MVDMKLAWGEQGNSVAALTMQRPVRRNSSPEIVQFDLDQQHIT